MIINLSLICGLRGRTVGTDTFGYYELAEILRYKYYPQIRSISDQGYLLYVRTTMILFKDPQASFIITSFIINSLMIKRLWNIRKRDSFYIIMTVYVVIFYFLTFSGIRQMIAVSIIFSATKYLDRNKIFKFMISIAIAFLFHKTALIAIIYLLVYLIIFKKLLPSKLLTLRTAIIFFSPLFLYAVYLAVNRLDSLKYYLIYISIEMIREKVEFGFMFIARVWLVIYAFAMLRKPSIKSEEKIFVSVCYALYVASNYFGLFFFSLGRIGIYFMGWEAIYFATPFGKKTTITYFNALLKALLIVYTLYTLLSKPSNDQVPYIPFWKW
jgi:hypothetical protein